MVYHRRVCERKAADRLLFKEACVWRVMSMRWGGAGGGVHEVQWSGAVSVRCRGISVCEV